MGNIGGPFMAHITLLLFLLGVATLTSGHSLALHHPKKEGCPPLRDMTFPSTIRVSLNMSGQSHLQEGDARKRSTTPWDYRTDTDYNRIPFMINEARCHHMGCLDLQGNVDHSVNSVPITQEILVLHREMKGCIPIFKLARKTVTVGCTCVRPVTEEQ